MSVESANESVATVAIAENVITVTVVAPGTTKGTVIITDADSQEVLTKDFNITCQDVVDSITFDNPTYDGNGQLTIDWGNETGTAGVTIVKHNDYTVSIESSNESVATVTYSDGVVTATRVSTGFAVGTIAIMNGATAVVSKNIYITVSGEPEIVPAQDTVTIDSTGGAIKFTIVEPPAGTTANSFTATSSDDTVVTTGAAYFDFDEHGGAWFIPLTYQGAGTATVTINLSHNNVTVATATVSVTAT